MSAAEGRAQAESDGAKQVNELEWHEKRLKPSLYPNHQPPEHRLSKASPPTPAEQHTLVHHRAVETPDDRPKEE
jgi:hypothetical protein